MKTSDFLQRGNINEILMGQIDGLYHNLWGMSAVKIKVDEMSYRLKFFSNPSTESIELCLTLANERPEPWTLTRTAQKDYIFQLHGDAREGGSTDQGRHENECYAVLIALLKANGFLED